MSGLDTLHVDASADATANDDASDDGGVDVAVVGNDAATDGAGIRCGPQTCTGFVCCVNPNGTPSSIYTCAKDACSTGVSTLRCDDKSDCANAQACCFNNGSSTCGPSGTSTCIVLCTDPSQCTGASQCVPFDAGAGITWLMRCQ